MSGEDFLSTTDYPSDKLSPTSLSGNYTALARYGAFQPRRTIETVTHGLTYELLPGGVWSRDNVTWFPFGVAPPDTSGAQPTFQTVEVDVYADATNVYIVTTNYTGSNVTIYYAVERYSRS